jgi:hypothetical protein
VSVMGTQFEGTPAASIEHSMRTLANVRGTEANARAGTGGGTGCVVLAGGDNGAGPEAGATLAAATLAGATGA